jgi:hypothetical protein
MPRALVFHHAGADIRCQPTKVDRSKLYGSVEVEATDDEGRPLELATIGPDGRTLIAAGGRAMAFVNPDRNWVDRGRLRPVDPDGRPLQEVPSSFDETIPLETPATIDDLLDHQVKSVYYLEMDAGAEALVELLGKGAIFRFPFAWRAGWISDVGFLLAGQDGKPFLLVAQPTTLHFVGLDQAAPVVAEEDVEQSTEEEINFGL